MSKWLRIVALAIFGVFALAASVGAQDYSLSGEWVGQQYGNRVRQTVQPGGIYVVAVTNNPGQSAPLFYQQVGPGEYHYIFPDGYNVSVMRILGPGTLRVTNPDGWTDVFRQISAPVAPRVQAPPPSPPKPALTTEEQQRINEAQSQLINAQDALSFCRSQNLGQACDDVQKGVAFATERLRQVKLKPSVAPYFSREEAADVMLAGEVNFYRICLQLDVPGQAAKCRADFDANYAKDHAPPTTSATPPSITPDWQSKLSQSSAAADQRSSDLAKKTRKYHNGANDATNCISVALTGTRVEWGIDGKMRMVNTCEYPVAVSWCANTHDCEGGHGNLWTINPGQEWPIFFVDIDHPDVRIGACRVAPQAVPPPPPGAPAPSERHLEPLGSLAGVHASTKNVCD